MGNTQSVTTVSVLATGEEEGIWAVRRSPGYADQTFQNPPEFQTMKDCLVYAYEHYGDHPYSGTRRLPNGDLDKEFHFQTYSEVKVIDDNLGSGLYALGLQKESLFGVFAENRPEWLNCIDISSTYGLGLVALYDTYGSDTLSTIITHSAIETLFVSMKNVEKVLSRIEEYPTLQRIILITDPWLDYAEIKAKVIAAGRNFYTFNEVCELGSKNVLPYPEIDPESIHYICYSSGTTGTPKGVIISHRSQTSNTLNCYDGLDFRHDEVHLSYLPLPHVFERIGISVSQLVGGRIGFFSGSISLLTEDMQILRPTHLSGVPRVVMRIYDAVMKTINKASPIVKGVFWGAYYWKKLCLRQGTTSPLADAIVFDKINQQMGGRLRCFIIGGAAMDPYVHEFMNFATGAAMRVGFGLSEIGAGSVCNPLSVRYNKPGTVGGPMICTEVKLIPLEDYEDKEAGEIMIGGQCLCSGYYKDDEATEKLFEENRRWVHTGDIGKWDKDGYLMVIDRIRSIFKLSQGEYVAAELLTQTLEIAEIVQQIFIYGDSSRRFLVAIIVPEPSEVAKFLGKNQVSNEELKQACESKELREEAKKQLNQIVDNKKLPGYERISNVYLEPLPWDMKSGMLTPTLKLKRKQLAQKYHDVIEKLYQEIDQK